MSKKTKLDFERDIERQEEMIEYDPKNANSYYLKAQALIGLSKITNDKSKLEEVLKFYNKAIELNPNNALYIVDRCKLYAETGKTELAIDDIRTIDEIRKTDTELSKGTIDIYIGNTITDITRLDKVTETIERLKSENKIEEALAEALISHAKVTSKLVIRTGIVEGKVEQHDQSILKLEELTRSVIKRVNNMEKLTVEEFRPQIINLNKVIKEQDERLDEHERRLNQIDNLMKEFNKQVDQALKDGDINKKEQKNINEQLAVLNENIRKSGLPEEKLKILAEDVKNLLTRQQSTEDRGDMFSSMIKKINTSLVQLKEVSNKQQEELKEHEEELALHGNAIAKTDKKTGVIEKYLENNMAVGMINKITYNNELLNYPELMSKSTSVLGYNRTIGLSERLSNELLTQAITSEDSELILAGLISLESKADWL